MTSSTAPLTDTVEATPSIARSGAWNLLTQVAPAISAIALTPFVIGRLGPERYGMYVLAISLTTFLGSFDGGLTASAGKYFSIYAGRGDAAAKTRLLVTLICALAVGGTLFCLLVSFFADDLVALVKMPAGMAVESAFLVRATAVVALGWMLYSVFLALINAHGHFAWTSLSYVVGYVVLIAGMLISLSRGEGLRAVAWVLLAQVATCVVLVLPVALRHARLSAVRLMPWVEFREYLSFALKVQAQGLAALVNVNAGTLLCGALLQVRLVGAFSVGQNLATQLKYAPWNLLRPIQAQLGRDFGRRDMEARATFVRLQRHWVMGVAGWSAVAAGSAYVGVVAWLGPDFARAGVVATILILGNAVWLSCGVMLAWLNITDHPAVEARAGLLSVPLNIALMLAAIPLWGVVGAAIAASVTQVASVAYLVLRTKALLPGHAPSPLREVPWLATTVAIAVSAGLCLAVRPVLPGGGFGLLLAAMAATPAGAVYLVLALGHRRCVELGRISVRRAARAFRSPSAGPAASATESSS